MPKFRFDLKVSCCPVHDTCETLVAFVFEGTEEQADAVMEIVQQVAQAAGATVEGEKHPLMVRCNMADGCYRANAPVICFDSVEHEWAPECENICSYHPDSKCVEVGAAQTLQTMEGDCSEAL